jgi:hypothetical protein
MGNFAVASRPAVPGGVTGFGDLEICTTTGESGPGDLTRAQMTSALFNTTGGEQYRPRPSSPGGFAADLDFRSDFPPEPSSLITVVAEVDVDRDPGTGGSSEVVTPFGESGLGVDVRFTCELAFSPPSSTMCDVDFPGSAAAGSSPRGADGGPPPVPFPDDLASSLQFDFAGSLRRLQFFVELEIDGAEHQQVFGTDNFDFAAKVVVDQGSGVADALPNVGSIAVDNIFASPMLDEVDAIRDQYPEGFDSE